MASRPITLWQIDGGKVETVTDCIFLGSKITVDGDCSYEIKTLAPWKESYDRLRQPIKRDITLPTKVRLVKAVVFPVVMYGHESWIIRLSAEELMLSNCGAGEDSLRVSWIARRSNQSILKDISPEYSLEGLTLKLKLWPSDVKTQLIGKDPDAGKD